MAYKCLAAPPNSPQLLNDPARARKLFSVGPASQIMLVISQPITNYRRSGSIGWVFN